MYRIVSLLVFLSLFTSCSTQEELFDPLCVTGDCEVVFDIDGELDKNGYYHVRLDFEQQYYPRFNVELDASITQPAKWYNGRPVVVAKFETDTYWQYQNDYLPVVQGTSIYFEQYSSSRAYTKRIVGPVPPQMKGDTIILYPTILWDGGNLYEKKSYTVKIIVE